ncbi:GGDEF domain-containing protein [bacterium]|nr:GGDEF domain-containing protein [bacterium]MBU1676681.1 GGDEF domain-containing protein [bacterium]
MTHEDKQGLAKEVLVERIRNEIIPLFDKLISGEETYFDNPYLERSKAFADGTPLHCPGSTGKYERCWQSVGEYRRQAHPDVLCFPHDCKECPVYRGACPSVVEELGEAFNNMVFLLHRKDETVRNAMNFTRDLALSLESMDLENHLMREQMHTDPLTGLYNRGYLDECLGMEVKRCRDHRLNLSLLMLDIDLFKSYNDLYGHLQGDRMLARFGRLLRAAIRDTDQAFRFGGEEFVVLLPGTSGDDAYKVAERIRERFATLVFNVPPRSGNPEGRESRTVSVGVTACADDMDAEALLASADQALYRAKNSGRNCVIAHSLQPVC